MIETPDLAGELRDLQARFDWPTQASNYELINTWSRERSGSRFLRFAGVPEGPEVVFKAVEGWASEDARRLFEAMVDLADVIDEAGIARAHAVRPLAWASEPAGLVMPYLDGTDLVTVLRDQGIQQWSEQVSAAMGKAGAMLAAYHRAHRNGDDATTMEEARRLAARFRIEWRFDGPNREGLSAGSFGDFGPGNLHQTAAGDLYLLDPPLSPTPALIHRDLGNFSFELRRQLAGRGFTPTPAVHGYFDQFRGSFFEGYIDQRNSGPLSIEDEALIALYEIRRSVGMARKRFPRRPGDAAWFVRSAIDRRREILLAQPS